ncbi:MAG TPA: tRNA preQ1(34) S-adenosylmethionine ribosyltransferase-isomerase QueA [Gemmatimonadales bacterium]|nr:tRNA preQ1(34) S-adenosylmethionine ribosyltransferase-isomerase QueA [Gemmatimonadales bacterium]
MTPERRLRTSDFEYHLPTELIAQHPLPDRGGSRLLVVRRGTMRSDDCPPLVDARFADLPGLISPGDLVVLNTTRVRHARFLGTRPSGAPAEVLLVQPADQDTWIAIGKPGSALRPGKRVSIGPEVWIDTVEVLPDGNRRVRFVGADAEEAMRQFGQLPLPPYIERPPDELDESRYQTIYADVEGSVAAPTAGLHFTPALLAALRSAGVYVEGLVLEVGTGTFKPVEVEDPAQHPMHPERYEITPRLAERVQQVRASGGRLWAVGTTVVRALESAARGDGSISPGPAETRLLILPGYKFQVVDRLITNFHLPRSTLLMLVCAFAGRKCVLDAYRHAVEKRYRFYSYGDAMVLI